MFTPPSNRYNGPPTSKTQTSAIKKRRVSVKKKLEMEMVVDESDLSDLFIINPPSFTFNDEEYVFIGLELPQHVENIKITSKGTKADVQVYLSPDYFTSPNVAANYTFGKSHTVLQGIQAATSRVGKRRDEPFKYTISFDLPFEIEAGYQEKIHPCGYDNTVNHCQIENTAELESQWHRVFMMIFKKKKVSNLETNMVGDLKYDLSGICSDSDTD